MPKRTLLVVVVLLFGAVSQGAEPQDGKFSARSDLVVLHVAVTDGRGAFVGGMPKDAFEILDEGEKQSISFFAEQDSPATIGLLIDGSGSMLESLDRIAAAIAAFAQSSHPDDEFLPLIFNDTITPVLPPGQRFTSDSFELRNALTRTLGARGRTRLHDALARALEGLDHGHHERKVLIVLSDGGDNASRLTFGEVREAVLASNVVIYSIAIVDPLAFDQNPKALRNLADATGGLSFRPRTADAIDQVFTAIGNDIRSRYTLAYAPPEPAADGRFRRIEVNVKPGARSRVAVRTRTGYVAGLPHENAAAGEGIR